MATIFTSLRAMFYLLLPSETYYERIEDVPDYVVKVDLFRNKRLGFVQECLLGYSTVCCAANIRIWDCLVSWKEQTKV